MKTPKGKLLLIGDSIARGYIYDDETGKYKLLKDHYASLVTQELGVPIINVSRFGNTLPREMDRFERDVTEKQPDIVMIGFGGNDCDHDWAEVASAPEKPHQPKTDLFQFRELLTGVVEDLARRRIRPVLLTLPPIDADRYFRWISRNCTGTADRILKWLGSVSTIYWWHERYNAAINWVAERTDTLLADIRGGFLEQSDYRAFICTDGIHPNAAGHRIMADRLKFFLLEKAPLLPGFS